MSVSIGQWHCETLITGILFWPSFHSETLICNGSCVVVGLAEMVRAEVRAG